jgi:hypothetical protein
MSDWVNLRPSGTRPGRSAPKGEADETGLKSDIGDRKSAFPTEAEVLAACPGQPVLANALNRYAIFVACPVMAASTET